MKIHKNDFIVIIEDQEIVITYDTFECESDIMVYINGEIHSFDIYDIPEGIYDLIEKAKDIEEEKIYNIEDMPKELKALLNIG